MIRPPSEGAAPTGSGQPTAPHDHSERMALSWDLTIGWDEHAWRVRAACRDSAPELFFPIGATGLALEQIEAAKAICTACPVRLECLDFALETNQEAGVWGGTSEDERRHLRKEWPESHPERVPV